MADILVTWQHHTPGGVPTSAAAVGAGAGTVRSTDTRLLPLEAVDIDQLQWCDGLVMGVHSEPWHVARALEGWRRVPAMRPDGAASGSVSRRYRFPDMTDGMVPNY